jgi:hypothetical protein
MSFFLLITGSAMLIIWIADINNKPDIDFSEGFFRAREKESGNIFWLHIVSELITGVMLICGGIIILQRSSEMLPLVYFSLGLLFYSSLNSLSWAFARPDRRIYRIPMITGLVISVAGFFILYFIIY